MILYKEIITILAVSQMDNDQTCIIGINEKGKWVRATQLNKRNLYDKNIIKPFAQTEFSLIKNETKLEISEEVLVFINDLTEPRLINVLNPEEQKLLLDKYLDNSIRDILESKRNFGIIKPIIEQVDFSWIATKGDYEARFKFRDGMGERYDFLCIERPWRKYWLNVIENDPDNFNIHLLRMQWTLNDEDTYFIVGLTAKPSMQPSSFDRSAPLILGVDNVSTQFYC